MDASSVEPLVYLRSETKIEPLAGRWYAWGHLLSPVQQALNIAFRQLPMLKSFVANPAVHEAASRNPKLMGGAFLELGKADLVAVRTLLQDTQARASHLIRFAEDLMNLERQVQKSEKGHSLDHLYDSLPESLAGLIEAFYDINNHPQLRVLEELTYDGGLDHRLTQEIAFSKVPDDRRNFFLNTPRLETPDRLILPLQFSGPAFDLLSTSRLKPVPLSSLAAALGVDASQREQLLQYFTAEAPRRNEPNYDGEGVRVRYFGHACVLLQTAAVSVLIDPFVAWDSNDADGRLTFNDLPDFIDYVFLTHNHQDHFCPELLLQLRSRIGRIIVPRNNPNSIADPSIKLAVRTLGFDDVIAMDPMERLPIPGGMLTSLPFYGEHADLAINSKHGMHIELLGRSLLFLADSDCKDRMLYRRIAARLGKVDTLFIGMECHGAPLSWLYGTYLPNPLGRKEDESRRLSGSDSNHAWAICEEFGCQRVYVYAMGQEPWLRFVAGLSYTPESKQIVESDRFVQICRDKGIPSERLYGSRTFQL